MGTWEGAYFGMFSEKRSASKKIYCDWKENPSKSEKEGRCNNLPLCSKTYRAEKIRECLYYLSLNSIPNCGSLTRLRGKAIPSLPHFGLGASGLSE